MFVKVENGVTRKHRGLEELRREFPQTSFPRQMPLDRLAEWGIYLLDEVAPPTVGPYQTVEEGPLTKEGGAWRQTWVVKMVPAEEMVRIREEQWQRVRNSRDGALVKSDWTQMPDVVMDAALTVAWRKYRQELRDITNQADPFNITWPKAPEAKS